MRHRLIALWALLTICAMPLGAQSTAAEDSLHWRQTKADLDSIKKDVSAPQYSKRAQARIRLRDSLRVFTPGGPVVATIEIHGTGASLPVGGTMQLTTTIKDASGNTLNTPVTWSTTSATNATITPLGGLLTGIRVGTVVAVAKSQTISASRSFTVTSSVTPPPDTTTPPPIDTTTPPVDTTLPPIAIFTHPYSPPSNGAAFAEMPRDTVPVGIPPVLRTINVTSLQAAYDTAKTGDLLKLPSGVTFISPTFAPTSRTGWVTIQGTDSTSTISQTVGGSTSAVNITPQAHHIYFLAPLTFTTTTSTTNAIYRSYNGETSNSQVAHHIVVNGVKWYVSDSIEIRRCAWPDGAYMAIINSRMYGCASKSGDAQGILLVNGPGPFRFENNYIEGGHQCFMSGGSDPSIPQGIPSDIVFRYNTCFKPSKWHYQGSGATKTYNGAARQIKTAFEVKNIRRALVEQNKFVVVYADAQAGFCTLLKSTNQGGAAPWSQASDITFRYNLCQTIASGANLAAHPQGGVAMTRVSMYGNWFKSLSTIGGEGICFQILDDVVDMIIRNNTFTNCTNNSISFDGVSGIRTTILNNVIPNGAYGVKGSSTGIGTPSIQKWVTNSGGLWNGNAIVGADCNQYPAGTTTCSSTIPSGVGADTTLVPVYP